MSKGNSYYEMNRDVFKNFVAREREFVKNVGRAFIKERVFISQGNKKVGDVVEIKIPRGTIKLRIDKISLE